MDGRSPTSLDPSGTASFTIVPRFASGPQAAAGPGTINRIRVTARLEKDNSVLATFVIDVDPDASEWDLQMEIPIPAGGGSVVLTIELVDAQPGGGEVVQWSGQSPPVPLTPGQPKEVKEIQVYRGPTDNLAVTGVTVTPDSSRIPEGNTVQLTATVTTTDPGASPSVYWASLDTALATVSDSGLVRGRLPGTARIVAFSGKPADTAKVVVTAIPRSVAISPTTATLTAPGQEASFTAQVLDARGAPIAGEQVTWRTSAPGVLESLGAGRFRARARGQAQAQARSVSDTTLSATASVSVSWAEADLALSKGSQATQVTLGDTVAFTVTVTNLGTEAAGAFTVRDIPPPGMTYVDGSAPTGEVRADSLVWHVPGLAVGASVTWRLDFRVDAAAQATATNEARIVAAATRDPDDANNADTHQVGVSSDADVGVAISATNTAVVPGDTLSLKARVTNAGPARARDVRVAVAVPAGLDRRSTQVSTGGFDPASGVWTVGELAAGASADLNHGVTVQAGAPPEITAEADWARFAPASDPNASNDIARTTLKVSPRDLDLAVVKRFSAAGALEDDTLRWSVTLVNRGPAPARSVRIADSLDVSGFHSIAVVASRRMTSTNPGGGQDTLVVDSLAAGDTARVEFQGVVRRGAAGRSLWNRARIASVSPLLALTATADDADSASVAVKSNVSDLQLRKTASRDTAYVGDTVRYVVTLRNTGAAKSRRLEVLDTFDATRFRSVAVTRRVNGMAGGVPGRLTTDSLAPGDSALVEITGVLDSTAVGTRVLNQARITRYEGVRDTIPVNDTASAGVLVSPRLTDLVVVKRVSRDTAAVGDTLVYDVRVFNRGPSAVTGFQLEEQYDLASLTGVKVTQQDKISGVVPGTLTGTFLARGDSAHLVFTAVVTAAAEGTLARNRAGLTRVDGATDTLETNDADSVATFVSSRTTDLALAKTVSLKGPLYPGDSVHYEIRVVNLGPAKVARVELQDSADYTRLVGARVVAQSRMSGAFPAGLYTDSLAPGDTAWISYVAGVAECTEGDTLVNVARIRAISGARDTIRHNDAASVALMVGMRTADLMVLKAADRDTVMSEDSVTYEIRLVNLGPDMAPHVEVQDSFDLAPWAFVDPVHEAGLSGMVPGILFADSLAAGDTAVFRYRAVSSGMVGGQAALNTARVVKVTGAMDANPANDTATAWVYLVAEADLNVHKFVDNPFPYEGDTLEYVVEVQNFGMHTAKSVQIFDSVPAGVMKLAASTTRGTFNPVSGLWALDSLPAGATDTLRLKVRVDSGTVADTLVNRAGVLALAGAVDRNAANDTASAEVVVQLKTAYLTLSKHVDVPTPFEGDAVAFTLTASNMGAHPALNLQVADSLGAGLTVDSIQVDAGSWNGSTRTWTLSELGTGVVSTLVMFARVDSGTVADTLWNRARILAFTGAKDTVTVDDTVSASVIVGQKDADLAIHKWADRPDPFEGDTVEFVVELTNHGTYLARNVSAYDSLPAGLTLLGHTTSRGTFLIETGAWTLDSLPAFRTDTLRLKVRVDSGTALDTLWNRAGVLGFTGAVEANPANDTSSASVDVGRREADLALFKMVDKPLAYEGDTVSFEVKIENHGSHVARNVQVFDSLAAGLTQLSHTTSRGTFLLETRAWTLDSIGPGQVDTLRLKARVDSGTVADTLWNRAGVLGFTHAVELNPSNDTASTSVTVGQKQADLALHKFVDKSDPFTGDTVTYVVELQNFGTHTARNVQVWDSVDAAMTHLSHVSTRGTFTPATRVWAVDSVAPGQTDSLRLKVRVDSLHVGDTLWNRARAFAMTGAVELDPSNDSASVQVTVQPRDRFALMKWATKPSPSEGEDFQYKIVVKNVGSLQITDVVVHDTIPAGITYLSIQSASQGTWNSTGHIWTVGTLNIGDSATLVLNVEPAPGTLGGTIVNRAWGAATPGDEVTSNNSAEASVTVAGADLFSVAKTTNNPNPSEGQDFQYRMVVKNVGPSRLESVAVRDTIPAGITYLSIQSASQGTWNSTGHIWTVGTLNIGDSATLVLNVEPAPGTSGQTLVNRAWGAAQQSDTVKGNNVGSASITVTTPDLSVGKISSQPTPLEGEPFSYLVWVKNVGAAKATGVAVFDTMPLGIALDSIKPTRGTYASGTWTVDTVVVGDSVALRLWVHALPGSAGVTRINRAWISARTQPDPNAANDTAAAGVTPAPRLADLAVDKRSDRSTLGVGDTVTYVIRVANNGPYTAKNVVVTDTFPTVLDLHSVSQSRGTFADHQWTLDTLAVGGADSLTVRMVGRPMTPPGAIPNTVRVKSTVTADTTLANDKDTATVVLEKVDVQLTKSASMSHPVEGQTFVYTVTALNAGNLNATGLQVFDTMPSGIVLDSTKFSGGSYSMGTWDVGSVSPGDADTIRFYAHPAAGMATVTLTNRAWVKALAEPDPNPANDTAQAVITPGSADYVQLTKTVDKPAPAEGDTVTFKVAVTNIGPGIAESVTVADSMKAGFAYISGAASRGTWAPPLWNLGSIYPGASDTLTLRFMVQSGTVGTTLLNRAWGKTATTDNTPGNDSASVMVHVTGVDIALAKVANDSTLTYGDTVTYTVRAKNLGPSGATNLVINDALPSGLTPVSWTPSAGAFDTASGNWGIGAMAAGDSAFLSLKARVDTVTETATNLVVVTAVDQRDMTRSNDTAWVSVTLLPRTVDLRLSKTVDAGYANVGDTLTYRVSLENWTAGAPVKNILVYDILPGGLTFVGDSTAAGASYNATTGYWSIPQVVETTTVKLKIQAAVGSGAAGGSPLNVAYIESSANHYDNTTSNDTAWALTFVDDSDVGVTVNVNKMLPVEGDSVVFTVRAQVADTSLEADSAVIAFPLPAGFTYLDHQAAGGAYDPETGVWEVGPASFGYTQLAVRAWVNAGTAGTPIAAVASLVHARPYDTYPMNNVDTVTVTPQAGDLQVTKSELYGRTSMPAGVADSVIYVIVVRNMTGGMATSVVVHDTVLAPLTFASYQATRGTFAVVGGVGVWTLDTIRGWAAPDTLRIRATYPAQTPGSYLTNRVRIMSMDQTDGTSGNNTSSSTISIIPADLNEEQQVVDADQSAAASAQLMAAADPPALFPDRAWSPRRRGAVPR